MTAPRQSNVLLVSDTAADCYLLHDAPRIDASQAHMDWQKHRQWHSWMLPGGVHLVAQFMKDVNLKVTKVGPASHETELGSLARLKFVTDKNDKKALRYCAANMEQAPLECRVESFDGYQQLSRSSDGTRWQGFSIGSEDENKKAFQVNTCIPDGLDPDIIVLNDAGGDLRVDRELVEKLFHRELSSRRVILKMHQPLAEGVVFEQFSSKEEMDRTIVVSADDLRRSKVRINRCLSWDAVIQDVKDGLDSKSKFLRKLLLKNARLLILFDAEAVISIESDAEANPKNMRIIFLPSFLEGDIDRKHSGDIVGKMSAFLSYLTADILGREKGTPFDKSIEVALQGLAYYAARPMTIEYSGCALPELRYPKLPELHDKALQAIKCVNLKIENTSGKSELLAEAIKSRPYAGPANEDSPYTRLAKDVVLYGTAELTSVPSARFGALLTVDRGEIEAFRAIDRLMEDYLHSQMAKPMSIAVFGPPGSGKSFGVEQLAKDRFKTKEFNLSQMGSSDLRGVFHEIRDVNLAGDTPLCFFDEFDSQELGLLSHFLAPMQDGKFRDGARIHPTGRGIYVFAGGTSKTYAEFAGNKPAEATGTWKAPFGLSPNGSSRETESDDQTMKKRRELKVPDFVSRLSGHIDIKGIDKIDEADDAFVLRRAILLRSFLEMHRAEIIAPKLPNTGKRRAEIDERVVSVFLDCGGYVHGARSMEQIVKMCGRGSDISQISVSDLPKIEQLDMHVLNAKAFMPDGD